MSPPADFLAELTLLRNDPALADRVRAVAERGDPAAQFALGLIYAEGRGVGEDLAEAYAWLTLAALQGDWDAVLLRWSVVQRSEPGELAEGQRRAGTYALDGRRAAPRH